MQLSFSISIVLLLLTCCRSHPDYSFAWSPADVNFDLPCPQGVIDCSLASPHYEASAFYPPRPTDWISSPDTSSSAMPTQSLPLPLDVLEQFALSSTAARQALLSQRVQVGTEDYFFLQLLTGQIEDIQHFLSAPSNRSAAVPPLRCASDAYKRLLAEYRERFPRTQRLQQIQLRHDLLTFPSMSEAQQSAFLQQLSDDFVHIRFDHVRHATGAGDVGAEREQPPLPTRLRPGALDQSKLLSDRLDNGREGPSALSSSPLAVDAIARWLHAHPKQEEMRRQFLRRLTHPGVPHVLELVEADLRAVGTSFGDCHIHRWLSLADLELLQKRRSDVAEQHDYVVARLNRLMPDGGDLDALTEDEKAALYDALVRYALTLKPVHGEVKANTLYHALAFKLQRGVFDLDLFEAFLNLPLPTQYPIVSRPHDPSSALQLTMSRGRLFPPVQPLYQALVTDLVRHFYAVEKEKKMDKLFGSFLDAAWLKQQCAIARLGASEELSDADREKYAGWLGRDLTHERDREILSFQPSATAPDIVPSYRVGEAMELTLTLKNVGRSLLVKVYRVNAAAYYRMQGKEIDVASLDLAGVVAHYEDTVALPAYSAYRRFTHKLSVSALLAGSTEHGVFVCEVTAGGQKARALLRRATLSFLSHDTTNGILMQLFDTDTSTAVTNSRVHLTGQTFSSNADGFILLPFAVSPRPRQPLVLTATDSAGCEYSSLATWDYPSEEYALDASVHVEVESLLAGGQSDVVIRPSLSLNQRGVAVSLLQKVRVHVITVHGDDVSSSALLSDVQLDDDDALIHTFTVPPRLRSLTVTIEGEVTRRSVNEKRQLSASRTITISSRIASVQEEGESESLNDLYLRLGTEGYSVHVLGKAGEAIAHRPVVINLQHRLLRLPLTYDLQTDADGQVVLGWLPGVLSVSATTDSNGRRTRSWDIDQAEQSLVVRRTIHAVQGEAITIPYPSAVGLVPSQSAPPSGSSRPSLDDLFSLYQADITDDNVVRRHVALASTLRVQAGYIQLDGLQPGRYTLLMKTVGQDGVKVDLRIAPSSSPLLLDEFVVHQQRVLQLAGQRAGPSVASVTRDGRTGDVVIEVAHPTARTRVHVVASHFVTDATSHLTDAVVPQRPPTLRALVRPVSVFLRQSTVGDETRYILDRKAAHKRVGNMLAKPSLLNHELERRGTSFDQEPTLRREGVFAPPNAGGSFGFASGNTFGAATYSAPGGGGEFGAPAAAAHKMGGPRGMAAERHGVMSGIDRWAKDSPRNAGWPSDSPANLDFLGAPSVRAWNAQPDDAGRVLLPYQLLSPHHSHLDIVVLEVGDGGESISRVRCPLASLQPSTPSSQMELEAKQKTGADGNLSGVANPTVHPHYADVRHFPPGAALGTPTLVPMVEQQQISALLPSQSLTIADRHTASVAVYDSLDDVYHLLHTLTASQKPAVTAAMDAFSFLLRWPQLSAAEKLERYSDFACHELHLFLHSKDKAFFDAIVRPYLRQKLQPTFVDALLMGEDVREWTEESRWATLNVVERVLLGRSVAQLGDVGLAERIFRAVQQQVAARAPESLEEQTRRFDTALHLKSLSSPQDDEGASEDGAQPVSGDEDNEESASGAADERRRDKESRGEVSMDAPMPAGGVTSEITGWRTGLAPPPAPMREARMKVAARPAAAVPLSAMAQSVSSSMAPPRRLYTAPPTTKEYQERNYWADLQEGPHKRPRVEDGALWADFARHLSQLFAAKKDVGAAPFLSSQLTSPTSSFTDVMAALSVLDLPFASARSPALIARPGQSQLVITAQTAVLVVRQEQQPARKSDKPLISVSANYYDVLDRYTDPFASSPSASAPASDAELLQPDDAHAAQEKPVTEFTAGRTYACRAVLFNPSAARVRVRVLQQVPEGAVAVGGGLSRLSRPLHLDSVSSSVFSFQFYFPAFGSFPHQAVQVSSRDVVVGWSEPVLLPVRPKSAMAVDLTSWSHIAASATDDVVLHHLAQPSTNVRALDWSAIAWRWRARKDFWLKCVAIARERLAFDHVLFAYSLHYRHADTLRLWLPTVGSVVEQAGPFMLSPLLRVDAESEVVDTYRFLEYRPLISSRAHPLGQLDRAGAEGGRGVLIQNREFRQQYTAFLQYTAFRYADVAQWEDKHRLQLCYYLLLQDRVDEALERFAAIAVSAQSADDGRGLRVHFDYLAAYLALYSEPSAALSIAKRYQQFPVAKKRRLFEAIEEQVAEITTKHRDPADDASERPPTKDHEDADTRDREMDALAATEPTLDFVVAGEDVAVTCTNVKQLTMAVHVMDLEPLFSSNPFLNSEGALSSSASSAPSSSPFLYLVPNAQQVVELPATRSAAPIQHVVPLPAAFRQANLLVSLSSGALLQSKPRYSHGLSVALMEPMGQLQVLQRSTAAPVSRVYVKVYARDEDGSISYYKDGYSDHRGRFDYASLSTQRLDKVQRFALLLQSTDLGAVIKEAKPPGQSR